MTPKIGEAGEDKAWVSFSSLGVDKTFTNWETLGLHINGTDPHVFCIWNGHQFETISGRYTVRDDRYMDIRWRWDLGTQPHEYATNLYFPIDPRIIEKDVVNATIAYPNETNDGWLFGHCDADYMRDREALLVATMTDAFAPMHRQLATAAMGTIVDNIVERFQQSAYERVGIMEEFHVAAEVHLRKWARSLHIGYYHQNPHSAHVNEPIEAAIRAAATEWAADTARATKLQKIVTHLANVLIRAAARHDYETRWDMAARIAAENRAAAAKGDDPVDGYEYCYAAVVSTSPITGDANLPDPAWNFDQLRDGPINRGDYRYTDAETPASSFLFLSIRFRRPIPAGTQPGADIGSVAWEQEPAHFAATASSS